MKKRKGWTALIKASENGFIDGVRELIKRGANLNAKKGGFFDKIRRNKEEQL